MTQNNGINGPDDRDDEETQILENPIIVNRVRQQLQTALNEPEGGFRSRRASIMSQIRAEAALDRAAIPPVSPVEDAGDEPTRRFTTPGNTGTPPTGEETGRFTLPSNNDTQRFEVPEPPEETTTQRFNTTPPIPAASQFDIDTGRFEVSQPGGEAGTDQQFNSQDYAPPPAVDPRFRSQPGQAAPADTTPNFPDASPPIRGLIGGNPVLPPPTPISVRPRKLGSRVPVWMSALAAALVLLVVAGAVFLYVANGNKNNPTTQGSVEAPALTSTQAAAAGNAAPQTTAAAAATTTGESSDSSKTADATPQPAATRAAATTVAATTAAATTSAASSASGAAPAATTAVAATTAASATTSAATFANATTAAATTAAATTVAPITAAATTAAATTQASGTGNNVPPVLGSVTPAPVVTSGPGATARATGLPDYPNSTAIPNLGSGRPIQFILQSNAARALPNPADRQARGLDAQTVAQYKFSGRKFSGLIGDDVVKFYQEQAVTAGYKVESTTDLLPGDPTGNKMRWIYLSKGSERVAVLVVDAADAETGSTFGLANNETGIYFCTN